MHTNIRIYSYPQGQWSCLPCILAWMAVACSVLVLIPAWPFACFQTTYESLEDKYGSDYESKRSSEEDDSYGSSYGSSYYNNNRQLGRVVVAGASSTGVATGNGGENDHRRLSYDGHHGPYYYFEGCFTLMMTGAQYWQVPKEEQGWGAGIQAGAFFALAAIGLGLIVAGLLTSASCFALDQRRMITLLGLMTCAAICQALTFVALGSDVCKGYPCFVKARFLDLGAAWSIFAFVMYVATLATTIPYFWAVKRGTDQDFGHPFHHDRDDNSDMGTEKGVAVGSPIPGSKTSVTPMEQYTGNFRNNLPNMDNVPYHRTTKNNSSGNTVNTKQLPNGDLQIEREFVDMDG